MRSIPGQAAAPEPVPGDRQQAASCKPQAASHKPQATGALDKKK